MSKVPCSTLLTSRQKVIGLGNNTEIDVGLSLCMALLHRREMLEKLTRRPPRVL